MASKVVKLRPLTYVSTEQLEKVEALVGKNIDLLDEQRVQTNATAFDKDASESISRVTVQLLDILTDCDGVIIPFNKFMAEASWQLKLSRTHKHTIFIMIRSGEPELL